MNKKAISVALSVVLVIGLLPIAPQHTSAFASEEEELFKTPETSVVLLETGSADVSSDEAVDVGADENETATVESSTDTDENKADAEEPEEALSPAAYYGEAGGIRVEARAEAGVFPEGTQMRVASVSDEEVRAALADDIAADETIVDIAAVDITFEADGQEVQPSDPAAVHVSLSTKDAVEGETLSLYHIDDEGQTEELTDAAIEPTGAEFDSLGFSIYAIIGADGKQSDDKVRRIYHFMQWDYSAGSWKEIESQVQILKNGDKIVEPNEPASTFAGGDAAADDEQFEGWVVTGNEPASQAKDVSGGTALEYKEITDIDESASTDEEVYVYAYFKVAYKAAFFDQNPASDATDVGIVDVLVSTDYADGQAIDVSRMTEIVKTQEGKAVSRWYLKGRGGATIPGFPETISADDKTTLKFSELKQTVFLYPDIVDAVTVSFDKNDSTTNSADPDTKTDATFTKAVKVAPGLTINAPTEPTREGYTFGGWYKNRACTGSAVNFATETFDTDTTLYAKWNPTKVQFRVILWEETVDDEYGKQVGDRKYKYVNTYIDSTMNAGTEVTWDLARSNFYTHYTASQIKSMFPYHVYPSSVDDIDGDLFIAGDGSSIFNIYFNLKEYKLTFNVNYGSRQGTITHNGTQYHGSTYSFTAKMGEKIGDKWPDAGEVSDITAGRTTYQFSGWKRSGSSTSFVTSRDELVPELLNTSGGSYVDTTFTANYGTSLSRAYIRYYLQTPDGSSYELSDTYSQYANSTSRNNWNPKDIEGFTYYREPSDNGKYDSNLKAYVWSFYYNRNTYDIVFINYDEVTKTTDKTRTGIAYEADISGEYYVPEKPESLKDKDYISFDGWYLDEYYQARFDENESFADKTMPNGNLTLYAKWKKGEVKITFDANGGTVEGQTSVSRTIEAESKLSDTPDDPVRDGYEFLGWYDEAGNAFDPAEPFTKDTTFYADWKSLDQFRVQYEVPDDEEGTAREDVYLYFDGANTSVNKITDQHREGFNFVGWKFRDGGDGTIYHENEMITIDAELADADNVIWLSAVYSTGVPIITKVTFDGNGGKTSGGEESIDKHATVDKYGDIQNNEWTTLPANTFTNEGYRFVEWNTKADGSGIAFAPDKAVGADILGEGENDYNTLYAIWEQADAEYTLNYYIERLPGETPQAGDILINGHYYGEIIYSHTGTQRIGSTAVIPPVELTGAEANKDDTKAYAEAHDQTVTDFLGYIVVSDKVKADGSTTLNYFYSRAKYKVSYTYAGVIPGDADPSAAQLENEGGEYVYGQEVLVIDDATANAYTFQGWHSTDVDGDIQKDAAGNYLPFTMPANDVEIFGLFTPAEGKAKVYIRYYVEIPNDGTEADTRGAVNFDHDSVDLAGGEPDYSQEDESYNFIVTGKDGDTRYYQLPGASAGRQYELSYPATVGDTVQAPSLSFAGVELDWDAVKNSTDFTKGDHDTVGDTTLSVVVPTDGVAYLSLYYNLVENPVSYYYLNDEVPGDASPASDELPKNENHKYGDVVPFVDRGKAEGYSFAGWVPDANITVIMKDGTSQAVSAGSQVPADAVSYVMPNGSVNFIGQFSINKYKYKVLHYQEILDPSSTEYDYQSDAGTKYKLVETQTKDATSKDLEDYYNTEVTAAQRSYEGFSFNSTDSMQKAKVKAYEDEADMLTLVMLYDRNVLAEHYAYAGKVPDGANPEESDLDGEFSATHKYGEEVKASNLAPIDSITAPGYSFDGWYTDAACEKKAQDFTIKEDTTFYGKFVAKNDTKYYEEHWLECLDQTNPETDAVEVGGVWYVLKDTEEKAGTTDATVNAEPKDYDGFAYNEDASDKNGVISGNPANPLVLHNYYDRKILTVRYAYASKVPSGAVPAESTLEDKNLHYKYGKQVAAADIKDNFPADGVSAPGYTFQGWFSDEECTQEVADFIMEGDTTVYGKFVPNPDTPYTVEFYYMDKGVYPTEPTKSETRAGATDSLVHLEMDDMYPDADHQGQDYEADTDDGKTVVYGYVKADGTLKLTVYFKQEFTINYLRGDYGSFTDVDNLPEDDAHAADGKTHFPNTAYGTSMADLPYDGETDDEGNPTGKPGAVFEGWSADVDVVIDGETVPAGTVLSPEDIAKIQVTRSIKLTATWTPPPTPATGILSDPPVKKVVSGEGAPTDDTFTFTLSAKSNTAGLSVDAMPMPAGSNGSTKTSTALKAGEEYEFGDIEFTLVGTYVYQIAEVNDGKAGYTYDQSVYTVTYVVTQEGNALSCERSIAKDGEDAGDIAAFAFTNTYTKGADPIDPDDPDDPVDPDNGNSDNNKTTPVSPGSKTASASSTKATTTAKTADSTDVVPLLVLAALSGGLMVRARRRKREGRERA